MFKVNSPDTSRPSSSLSSHTGRIPGVAMQDSGVRLPDNNVQQFKNEKAREQWAITKQVSFFFLTLFFFQFFSEEGE